ncbi:late competence development ComFB family protein [Solibacillus sp. FSL H8-0538]|uniref:late competence development ComFB family protein n=1 Tax=Solibacillus sp. FSL H8-0538 TaxID=2921400 RepID=UPI0030FA7DBF
MTEPVLGNVIEEIVSGLVRFLLHGNEYQTFCHCKVCELDIIAITLNTLPPKYVTTKDSRDAAFQQLNTPENIEMINKQIIRAIHIVGRNPRHENEPSSV